MKLCSALITLLLMAPAVAEAAAPSSPPSTGITAPAPQSPQATPLDELDEVFVEGRRNRPPTSWDAYQRPFDFLARLVGQFVVEGHVDLHGQGRDEDLRKATGGALCLGFGSAPGVQCEMNVQWPETKGPGGEQIPGGVSALNPAVLLFGYEPEVRGVSHVVVDNMGVADAAVGRMTSADSIFSRSPCVDIAGDCQRSVRITAEPELRTVHIDIDLAIDGRKAVNFMLVLQRVPDSVSVVHGRNQTKEKKKK